MECLRVFFALLGLGLVKGDFLLFVLILALSTRTAPKEKEISEELVLDDHVDEHDDDDDAEEGERAPHEDGQKGRRRLLVVRHDYD